MQESSTRTAILVSHTHWDRAWYLSFEEFRFKLVGMIDRILELLKSNDSFKCFVLDGQTILIDDYLEIRPENEDLLRELISNQRLIIGPWYILPDLFLVSGESIIRNLMIGNQMSTNYGGSLDVGYVPDPFGHIAQLPQILNGFDISTFIFMRGLPKEVKEQKTLLFNWVAPNKDQVLAYNTKDGYLNAANLGYEKEIGRFDCNEPDIELASDKIDRTISNLSEFYPKDLLLLNNGMDHMPEQPEIPKLISRLNDIDEETHIIHGSFSDFMDEAKSLDTPVSFTGNLVGNEDHPILLNVYSTRVYLKQQNQLAQSILEKIAEPLSLIAKQSVGHPVPDAFFNYSWKTLLKNHPHDDICGCSADAVHQDNEMRFRHVMENGHSICIESIEAFSKAGFSDRHLSKVEGRFRDVFVFNPHPFSIPDEALDFEVVFPNTELEEEEILPEKNLKAYDEDGNELPLDIISTEAPFLKAEFIQFTWGRKYKLKLRANLPPTGYKVLRIVETDAVPENPALPSPNTKSVENERYKINITDSGIAVRDKQLDIDFPHFLQLEFTQDNGDTYSYSKASNEIYADFLNARIPSQDRVIAEYSIDVPKGLNTKKTTHIPIRVTYDLSGNEIIKVRFEYENTAKNGRLRALFPIGFKTNNSLADGHFMIYDHAKRKAINPDQSNGKYDKYPGELNYTTNYQNDYCLAEGPSFNTWVANRGLNEYEVVDLNDLSYFAITLHRAVGFLSVSNGSIRRPHAGPKIATPEAQCLREMTADLCWATTEYNRYEIAKRAKSFSHPVYIKELPFFKKLPQKGDIPRDKSFLNISDARIQLSAFKQVSGSEDIIMRIYNVSDQMVRSTFTFGFTVEAYSITTFLEQWENSSSHEVNASDFDLEVPPHQIMTLRLRK
jgi:mannosylglycerate hydrolase